MKFKNLIVAALALGAFVGALDVSSAVIPAYTAFSAGSTNGGTATSWAISSAHSAQGGVPVVTYVQATSDTTNAYCTFYRCDALCVETYATNSTTTLSVNTTNGIFDGGVVVIRHILNDTYEKRIAGGSPAASTNLVLTVAPMMAVSPGDIIYHMTTTGAPQFQLFTNSTAFAASGTSFTATGSAIAAGSFLGGETTPILAEVTGASKSWLNGFTVYYLPVVPQPRNGLP